MLVHFLLANLCAIGWCLLVQSQPYFYIYEWPEYIHDVWPPMNATLHKTASYSHNFRGNNGAGKLVDSKIGYFSTWQFAMYQLTMARLRASPFRTLDPNEATSFIVPFDIGVHSFIDHMNGRVRVASPHGWRVTEWMKESIEKFGGDKQIWKNRGHDHFVLFSITSYQIIGIGAKVFLCNICQNCTVLTIETTPSFTSRKYYSNKSRKWWYAVPYPSSFHWHPEIKEYPWQQSLSRPYLSIFIGSVDTSTPRSNIVRRTLKRDCQEDDKVCLWFDTAHACQGVLNQTDAMLLYRRSVFCLAPPGDSLTRKSLFDSLLSGCIPVVFAKATITQYMWHIPPEVVDKISIYIPAQLIIDDTVNFLSILRNISDDTIRSMQRDIEQIAPRLQYSVVPDGYGASEEEAWKYYQLSQTGFLKPPVDHRNKRYQQPVLNTTAPLGFYKGPIYVPPVHDAVDIIIERILNRSTVEPMQGFTPEEVVRLTTLRDDVSAGDPDYAGFLRTSSVLAQMEKEKQRAKKIKRFVSSSNAAAVAGNS